MKTLKLIQASLAILILFSASVVKAQTLPPLEECTQIEPVELDETPVVARIYYNRIEDIPVLNRFDVFEFNNHELQYVLAAVTQFEMMAIKKLGFRVEVDEIETANFNKLHSLGDPSIDSISGYSCYRTVEETYAAAEGIVRDYPKLASWNDVGDSWEKSVGQMDGYDMMVLKLTNSEIGGEKPKLFITASIHAREYTPAELATRFAEHLVTKYNVDPDITWILDYHEIHLMLMANPDGRKEAEVGRSWRKNTNENYCGITSTNRGADLNRNFEFYWNSCRSWDRCSSPYPCDSTYRGPIAASEPETQAIQNYLRAIFPDQRTDDLITPASQDATGIYLDLHSYSELVLWSWGMTSKDAPNAVALQTLGRKFAYFNYYTPQQASDLYLTDGATDDFGYGTLGVASYTFELGNQFFEECDVFENTIYPDNLQALLYAAKVVRTPYLTPQGPDSINLTLSDGNVRVGDIVTLSAVIDDSRYRSGTGEPVQAIKAWEYSIDTPPWDAAAEHHTFTLNLGSASINSSSVSALIDTTGLSQGRHTIFVRGQDTLNNWGAVSAIFLYTWEPTAIELSSFEAIAYLRNVAILWETNSEIDNLGFNLYRANTIDGTRLQLNQELIPTKSYPGASFGSSYSFIDRFIKRWNNYYYWLETLNFNGETELFGPVLVRTR